MMFRISYYCFFTFTREKTKKYCAEDFFIDYIVFSYC